MSMLNHFANQMHMQLTPAEEIQMQEIISLIEDENGPMNQEDKPRHLGNYRFSFAHVPTELFRTIAFGFPPKKSKEMMEMLR